MHILWKIVKTAAWFVLFLKKKKEKQAKKKKKKNTDCRNLICNIEISSIFFHVCIYVNFKTNPNWISSIIARSIVKNNTVCDYSYVGGILTLSLNGGGSYHEHNLILPVTIAYNTNTTTIAAIMRSALTPEQSKNQFIKLKIHRIRVVYV